MSDISGMMIEDDSLVGRAPRLAAGLTFAAIALAHVAIVIALMGAPTSIAMPALYVVVHFVAGLMGGRTLLDPACTPTTRTAALRGIAVMALALLLLWLTTLAIVLPSPYLRSEAVLNTGTPTAGNAFYAITTRLGLAYLTWMLWLLPLGALGGSLLYSWPRHNMIASIED